MGTKIISELIHVEQIFRGYIPHPDFKDEAGILVFLKKEA